MFAVLSIALASCSSSSTSGDTTSAGSLIPLFIGNYWVTDSTVYDANGAAHAGGEDSIKVLGSTISPKDGSTYFNLKYFWVMKTNTGLFTASPPNFYNAYLFFKYPANPGETFREHSDIIYMPFPTPSKPDSITTIFSDYKVTSNGTPITVPAGSFSCYEYTAVWNQGGTGKPYQKDVYYFAPGVGFIRTEHYSVIAPDNTQLKIRSRVDLKAFKVH